ncbi:EF-hand domain-containing protein [Sphingomonas sp.]|uniref:EF-hand domain-containing protein n=1 Tax=Sphingomonas sp. TaxID=28214 RepID=UPI001D74301D|nr:EF-hand domain-containing protein [Sphingomonas sp.]MBX9795660.1 EF-hand domain-containing protein [Sphingomonas sp.]
MWRYLAGAVAALLLAAMGTLWFTSRAQNERPALLAAAPAPGAPAAQEPLPDTVPEADPKTREQRRFGRYDKDEDGRITRAELLTPRRKAFAKLDTNGDGVLSFDEWVVRTTKRFDGADANRDGSLTPAEFATTAPKRRATPRCACPPPRAGDGEEN